MKHPLQEQRKLLTSQNTPVRPTAQDPWQGFQVGQGMVADHLRERQEFCLHSQQCPEAQEPPGGAVGTWSSEAKG